jgi:hypothetical protein
MFVKTHLLQKKKCGGVMVRDFGPQNGGHGFKSIYIYPIHLLGSYGI